MCDGFRKFWLNAKSWSNWIQKIKKMEWIRQQYWMWLKTVQLKISVAVWRSFVSSRLQVQDDHFFGFCICWTYTIREDVLHIDRKVTLIDILNHSFMLCELRKWWRCGLGCKLRTPLNCLVKLDVSLPLEMSRKLDCSKCQLLLIY